MRPGPERQLALIPGVKVNATGVGVSVMTAVGVSVITDVGVSVITDVGVSVITGVTEGMSVGGSA
jgi:hypothetical protein